MYRASFITPMLKHASHELEWVSVTSGNMNVLNSVFIFCVGPALFWCYAKGRMSLNGCQWLVVTWRGENEAVTFGNMNVLNSAFIHCVSPGMLVFVQKSCHYKQVRETLSRSLDRLGTAYIVSFLAMSAASGVPCKVSGVFVWSCEFGDGIAKCTIYFLVIDGHSHIDAKAYLLLLGRIRASFVLFLCTLLA